MVQAILKGIIILFCQGRDFNSKRLFSLATELVSESQAKLLKCLGHSEYQKLALDEIRR